MLILKLESESPVDKGVGWIGARAKGNIWKTDIADRNFIFDLIIVVYNLKWIANKPWRI